MRLATVTADGEALYGVVDAAMVYGLSPDFPHWPSLREVDRGGGPGTDRGSGKPAM